MPDIFDQFSEAAPAPAVEDLVREQAKVYGVDPDHMVRLARLESNLDHTQVSPKGAIGVMQLMPGTAKDLGVNPYSLEENVKGGVRYYRQLLDRFKDPEKATAAYNAGPERVASGKPLPRETEDYVSKILPKSKQQGGGDIFDQIADEHASQKPAENPFAKAGSGPVGRSDIEAMTADLDQRAKDLELERAAFGLMKQPSGELVDEHNQRTAQFNNDLKRYSKSLAQFQSAQQAWENQKLPAGAEKTGLPGVPNAPLVERYTPPKLQVLPPYPKAPVPPGLMTDAQQQQDRVNNNSPVFTNPRTGKRYYGDDVGRGPGAVLDAPMIGAGEMAEGAEQMAEPGLSEKAKGLHKVIGGAFEASTPLLAATGITAPVSTALGVGMFTGVQAGTEHILKALGLPEEYAAVAGDLTGLFGAGGVTKALGTAANRAYWRARIKSVLQDKLNREYAERSQAEKEAQKPKQIGGDVLPEPAQPAQKVPDIQDAEFEDNPAAKPATPEVPTEASLIEPKAETPAEASAVPTRPGDEHGTWDEKPVILRDMGKAIQGKKLYGFVDPETGKVLKTNTRERLLRLFEPLPTAAQQPEAQQQPEVSGTPEAQQPAQPTDLLSHIQSAPDAEHGVPVSLPELRSQSGLPKEDFDKQILGLADQGKIYLTTVDHVHDGNRGELVHDPESGKYYVAASVREPASGSVSEAGPSSVAEQETKPTVSSPAPTSSLPESVAGVSPKPATADHAGESLAPGTEILQRFPNHEDGTEAVVAKTPRGYSAILRDSDANEAVGGKIFPTLDQAVAHAKELAGVKDAAPSTAAAPTIHPDSPYAQDDPNALLEGAKDELRGMWNAQVEANRRALEADRKFNKNASDEKRVKQLKQEAKQLAKSYEDKVSEIRDAFGHDVAESMRDLPEREHWEGVHAKTLETIANSGEPDKADFDKTVKSLREYAQRIAAGDTELKEPVIDELHLRMYAPALSESRLRPALKELIKAGALVPLPSVPRQHVKFRIVADKLPPAPPEQSTAPSATKPAKQEKPETPAPSGPIPHSGFMNLMDIDEAVERYKKHPVLSRATKFLQDLRDETDAHSDGWAYWKLPVHAAGQLMGMIQHPEYATEENLRKALAPIRAFYTKRGTAAGMKFPDIELKAGEKPAKPAKPAETPTKRPQPGDRVQINSHTGMGARPEDFGVIDNISTNGKTALVKLDTGGEREIPIGDVSHSTRPTPEKPETKPAHAETAEAESETPAPFAWTKLADAEMRKQFDDDPHAYYDSSRYAQKTAKAWIDGEADRLASVAGKPGAADKRKAISAATDIEKKKYENKYAEIGLRLGPKASSQLRKEIEKHSPQVLPQPGFFGSFWSAIRPEDKIATPAGPVEIIKTNALTMQPILPTGRGGWSAIGASSREVYDVDAKLPDGTEKKFRKQEFFNYLYPELAPKEAEKPAETKPAETPKVDADLRPDGFEPPPQGELAVTGPTFKYKGALRQAGGRWDASAKAWLFVDTPKNRKNIQSLSKQLVITEHGKPKVTPEPVVKTHELEGGGKIQEIKSPELRFQRNDKVRYENSKGVVTEGYVSRVEGHTVYVGSEKSQKFGAFYPVPASKLEILEKADSPETTKPAAQEPNGNTFVGDQLFEKSAAKLTEHIQEAKNAILSNLNADISVERLKKALVPAKEYLEKIAENHVSTKQRDGLRDTIARAEALISGFARKQEKQLPPGIPDPVRKGDQFFDHRFDPPRLVAEIKADDPLHVQLKSPYDQMKGADRHLLLGAMEHYLKHPEPAIPADDEPAAQPESKTEPEADLAASAGFSADDIIGAAIKNLEGKRGPAKPVKTEAKPETPANNGKPKAPKAKPEPTEKTPSKPTKDNPMSAAADEARKRLRERMAAAKKPLASRREVAVVRWQTTAGESETQPSGATWYLTDNEAARSSNPYARTEKRSATGSGGSHLIERKLRLDKPLTLPYEPEAYGPPRQLGQQIVEALSPLTRNDIEAMVPNADKGSDNLAYLSEELGIPEGTLLRAIENGRKATYDETGVLDAIAVELLKAKGYDSAIQISDDPKAHLEVIHIGGRSSPKPLASRTDADKPQINRQDLVDLATIGAEHILDGAHGYPQWTSRVTADVGELVNWVAEQSGLSPETVLRQVHAYAAATAKHFGVEVSPAPAASPKVEPPNKTGAEGLIDAVYSKLKNGESLGNVTEFNKLAEEHFGNSRASGDWTPKDAFDAMEAGINKYLIERGKALMEADPIAGLVELRQLMARITSQGVRTEDQIKNQQFSTPPTISYVVSRVAGVKPTDVVLEPSAGNGGLVIWPKSIGAEVHVNEISDRRAKMLEAIGFGKPTAHDGEIINALLPKSLRPTVIVMNPPFSAGTVKSGPAKNSNQYGFNHVDSALQRLAPGGRLVAILGGGLSKDTNGGASLTSVGSGKWFERVAQQYNVRANIRLDGSEYQKYGTSFATRIIVIDKDGPTPSRTAASAVKTWDSVQQGNVKTLEEAYNLLRNVADSRPASEIQPGPPSATGTGKGDAETGLGASAGDDRPSSGGVPQGGNGTAPEGELSHRPEEPSGDVSEHGSGAGSEQSALQQPKPRSPEADGSSPARPAESSAQNADEQRPLEQPQAVAPESLSLESQSAEGPEEEDSAAYVTYRPTLKGPAHPGDIVETKTMATVPMPAITYRPSLPPSVLENGGLSAVQLEAIAIAGQQNSIVLPGGFRASALIGDGTGVGKGRISAGILWDNYRQGRKRLVWVSEKWDLMQDAIRDLTGIKAEELLRLITRGPDGQYLTPSTAAVQAFQKFKAGTKIDHDGVIFSTYALIRSENNKGDRRVAQLEEYLRGDDDADGAFILFDEAHNLKNAVAGNGGQVSQIGKAVKDLLGNLPKLRSVSLSATAATDVVNLGYLDRLGLWGPGTAFPNGFNEFQTQVAPGGMAAMELIARELKAQGKYVSRTLSFKGVTYDEQEHVLTGDQKELYRTASKAWSSVLQSAEASIASTTKGGGRQLGRFMAQFYGAQQRFFNVLISTLKVPTAVKLAKDALAADKSVVITLVNTNEAAQNREKNKARDLTDSEDPMDFDFGPKEMLVDLVRTHYPVQQYRDDVDSAGNPIKVPVYTTDENGREIPVNNPDAEAARDSLIEQINRDLHMPENPLDILIQSLGGDSKVAELTGRKERYDRALGKFVPRGDPNAKRDQVNLFEMRAFQGGKKRIAILSSAAGTGISLHAGNDVKNQQRRYHITLQVGWSADKQMQMFGRTHRTNQVHPPEYVMLVSDLGGERRFVATIARRLGSLGALTKGQKNAASGTDLMDKVNFETDQGRQATNAFYTAALQDGPIPGTGMTGLQLLHDLHVLKMEAGTLTVPQADRTNVTRLLNRLLALDPDTQNGAYNYYYDIFQAVVKDAIDRGTLDTGVKTLPGDEFEVKEARSISKDPKTGADTTYYKVDAKIRMNRISPQDLEKRLQQHRRDNPALRRNSKGQVLLSIDAQPIVHADATVTPASYVAHPGEGKWVKISNSELASRYQTVEEWARTERENAEKEQSAAEREVASSKRNLEEETQYQRERLAREPRARLRYAEQALDTAKRLNEDPVRIAEAQRAVDAASEDVKRAETSEIPDTSWARRSLASAENKLTEKREALAKIQEIAKDPGEWAKDRWKEQYETAPTHRTETRHLIGGAVMRWWNPLKEATFLRDSIYTTSDSKTGQRVVGIAIPEQRIGQLLKRIEGGGSTVNASQLYADVLRNNLRYTLESNIEVLRGRVGRTPVVQLIPPSNDIANHLKTLGVSYERGITPVYYIPENHSGPLDSQTSTILHRVLNAYPVKPEEAESTPLASRGASRQPVESIPARFKRDLVYTTPEGLQTLGDIWGISNPGGLSLNRKEAAQAAKALRAQGHADLAKAIEQGSAVNKQLAVVGSDNLGDAKQVVRHERMHAAQLSLAADHLGKYEAELLAHPAAKKAQDFLSLLGVPKDQVSLEIGANLAAGQWEQIGLSPEEAEDLFFEYATLLLKQHGAQVNEKLRRIITPKLRQTLINATEQESSVAPANGAQPDSSRGRGKEGPGGISESVREDVPAREQGPESPLASRSGERGSVPVNLLTLGAAKFAQDDIVPAMKDAARALAAAKDGLQRLMAPASRGIDARDTAGVAREHSAQLARSTDQAIAALEKARVMFDRMPEPARLDFIDRIETGKTQTKPELQLIANVMRKMLDDRRDEVQNLGTGKLQNWYQDYFPHAWKDPAKATNFFAEWFGKRPMEGSKSFLRKRSIPTIADGIANGLIPASSNPVDLVLTKVREMDKYLMAHHVMRDLKDMGLLKYVRSGDQPPAGWAQINDAVATVYGPRSGAVSVPQGANITPNDVQVFGQRIMGRYYAPEQAATVINNHLSPGLSGKSALFRAYLGAANVLNQFQLGWSAFHLGFTSVDAYVSGMSLGLYKAMHGKFAEGGKDIAKAPMELAGVPIGLAAKGVDKLTGGTKAERAAAPFSTLLRGDKLLKEWYRPGTQGAETARLVDAAVKAGARAGMGDLFQTQLTKRMLEAWRQGNVWGAALRLPFAITEQAARPIMEYVVPRQKFGVFADLAKFELDRLPANAPDEDVRAALGRAWDSVDNRLGQLVYDNLFWNKSFKELLMASVRSVGWNSGTIRELGGGVGDTFKTAGTAMKGQKPDFTPRMSYVVMLPIAIGLLGAVIHYLQTGEHPEELRDYYFPRRGKRGTPGWNKRMSLPSYVKDVVHYSHDFGGTVKGKIHPLINLIAEMWENEDFYGHPIRNAHDPWVKKAEDTAKHVLKQFEPMAVRPWVDPAKNQKADSAAEKVLPFIGVTPAPKFVTNPDTPKRQYRTIRVPVR